MSLNDGAVAREALERLLVALGMAGVALLVLGGSRWLVWTPVLVLFPIDLYGSVALLWLVSASRAVGVRFKQSAHSAMLGSASGVMLFQSLEHLSPTWKLAPFAAGIVTASTPKRWTGWALGCCLATLAALQAATWDDDSLFWMRAGLIRLLGVAPIFVGYALYLRSGRSSRNALDPLEPLKKLTFALAPLAVLELIGTPTSLLLLADD